jgi:signal transduction histidine kinase
VPWLASVRGTRESAPGGLRALPLLADRVTAAGLAVRMDVGELPELSPGVDLSAYRIVQEAVTNALRHATDATEVEVVIRQHGPDIVLRVADDGRGSIARHGNSMANANRGHGLVGMRERAAAFGGRLQAGPGPGGGFVVWARLPITGPAGG